MRRRLAWDIGDPRHGPIAQLLLSWAPLSLLLLAYGAAQWVSAPIRVGTPADHNRLGLGVHLEGPAAVDRLGFGVVPSAWLQARLADGHPHWYDAVAALVYVTHFVAIPLLTPLAWFRLRDRFRAWIVAVLAFTALGVVGYVVFPAAPPWLASDQGVIGSVHRLSGLGWDYLHVPWLGALVGSGQQGGNPVAAMPSLHAGAALLVTLFLWPVVRPWWRGVLSLYVVLMALTLVYTGEHYVVDVLAGWVVAALGVWVGALSRRV